MGSSRNRHNSWLRRAALSALDAALLGGIVARWSYRCGLHGRLGVTEHEVRLAGGRVDGPLLIAFASDFHGGPTTHPQIFTDLVDELTRRRPDVLLLGGDYVSCKAQQVDVIADALARCDPPLGKFAVVGNHDLLAGDERIVERLSAAGVRVLINRNCPLQAPFECVSVCGIDDPWTGSADVAEAFRGAGAVRIFLSHSPDGLLLLGNEQFDVGFAGHTHGGQIALPDGTAIIGVGGPLSRAYGWGRFEIAGNGPLIVSRGVGCSNLPIRINADPELVMCRIVAES